jgi:hypothetical protein
VNRSSIILAFIIAGFISVTLHDIAFGPVAYGPNNAMHKVAKKYQQIKIVNTVSIQDLASKN